MLVLLGFTAVNARKSRNVNKKPTILTATINNDWPLNQNNSLTLSLYIVRNRSINII